MSNIYNMADTWTGGTLYTAIKMNVTDTSSDAASLLLDLQVGSVSKASVSKTGAAILTSLALGGATIGASALAVTGVVSVSGQVGGNNFAGGATGSTNYALNSAGSFFGQITNISNDLWGLGFGATKTTLGTSCLSWDGVRNVILGSAAIATNATDGFLHVVSGAGPPTGTPTLFTGRVPLYVDTTNAQLWLYLGGAWKQPKTPAGAALVTWQ